MRFTVFVVLCLILAACATNVPESKFQSQSKDILPWEKPNYFSWLSAEEDYYPNELIAVFDNSGGGRKESLTVLNQAINDAIQDGLEVNGIPVQSGSIELIDVYPTDPIGSSIAPPSVCGKDISHFTYSFPGLSPEDELEQAIATLLAISDGYLLSHGKSLYGISPKGVGPGTTGGQSSVASNSFATPAFTSSNWAYKAVNATQVFAQQNVLVAVLDTGVNAVGSLQFYAPANFVALNPDKTPTQTVDDDFDNANTPFNSNDGHGTAIASLIADATYGVAPDAIIIPVKTCDGDGICNDITTTRGICYAQAAGADVINMSFGGLQNSPMVEQAIREVVALGTTVVASSGNTNIFASPRTNLSDYPARWADRQDGLMSVGAIDENETYANFATADEGVELVAPGSDANLAANAPADYTGIESYDANGNAAYFEGTSFAAPFVAGAAANLYAQCPDLSINNIPDSSISVEKILKGMATTWNPDSQDPYRSLPWPLATNGFTPGLLNIGDSLGAGCP